MVKETIAFDRDQTRWRNPLPVLAKLLLTCIF